MSREQIPTMARSPLDDPAVIGAADPSGMLGLIASMGGHLREGFHTAATTPALPSGEGVRSVVVCGMGGSGVSGDVLRSLYGKRLTVPAEVCKGQQLPEFCARDTLVVTVSFSGNTEETLSAYRQAVARGCRVVAVTAGGELAALAEADDVPRVPVPARVPVPRAALGYLSAAPLGILEAIGLVAGAHTAVARAAGVLDELARGLGPDRPTSDNEAKATAGWLVGRTAVIWGSEGLAEAAAWRWKTGINENAKIPAWASVLPELDHNEIEGWSSRAGSLYAVMVLRHEFEAAGTAHRVEATLQAIEDSKLPVRQIRAASRDEMAALFSLIMLGDFVSTYLAILRGVDPTPVPVLTSLKERLRE